MIGRVRGRINSAYGSRRIRHYFCQSGGRGFYLMQEKVLRGRGKGFLFVGSYSLFMRDNDAFMDRLVFNWRDREQRLSAKWKRTMGAIRVYGGEIRR